MFDLFKTVNKTPTRLEGAAAVTGTVTGYTLGLGLVLFLAHKVFGDYQTV